MRVMYLTKRYVNRQTRKRERLSDIAYANQLINGPLGRSKTTVSDPIKTYVLESE
jgi:hypothetical protein